MDQTDGTSIVLKFEHKDGTAGSVTQIDLTVDAGKEAEAMRTLMAAISSGREVENIWDKSSKTSSDFTAISIDSTGDNANGLTPGTAISGSANTIYHSFIEKNGNIIRTSIYIDLTDLEGTASANQIVGIGSNPSHLGQITDAKCGTIFDIVVTCIEAPDADLQELDIIASSDSAGKKGDDYGGGGDFTDPGSKVVDADYTAPGIFNMTARPASGDFLYLASVTASADTATSGKLLIELYGTE